MENQDEHEFTFGKNNEEAEYLSDANDRRIAKLTQKVTLLSILIPCILGFLVIFLYFDITNKVGQVDSSGSTKVQNISKELENTILKLTLKSDNLERNIVSKIDKIDKRLIEIKKKLKKAEKNISFLTYSKSNKKSIKAELEKFKKNTTTTTKGLSADLSSVEAQTAQLLKISESLKARTDGLDTLEMSVKTIETKMAIKTDSFVNKKDLDNVIKKQKRLFQLEIKDNIDNINKKIALLKFANQSKTKQPEVIEKTVQ